MVRKLLERLFGGLRAKKAPPPPSASAPRARPPTAPKAEAPPGARVTSREESDRLFKKVYDGLVPPSAPEPEPKAPKGSGDGVD